MGVMILKRWDRMATLVQAPWEDYPESIVIPNPGASIEYDVSGWRYVKPVLDESKCTSCGFCWLYCPDNAVEFKDGKMRGFRYYHCKGCGVCEQVCPANAIKMVEEIK